MCFSQTKTEAVDEQRPQLQWKDWKPAHVRMMLQMKIAGMEHRVVKITRRVANWGSRLYLDDSMTVVAPAGMAASKVLTPVTILLTGSFLKHGRHCWKRPSGSTTS